MTSHLFAGKRGRCGCRQNRMRAASISPTVPSSVVCLYALCRRSIVSKPNGTRNLLLHRTVYDPLFRHTHVDTRPTVGAIDLHCSAENASNPVRRFSRPRGARQGVVVRRLAKVRCLACRLAQDAPPMRTLTRRRGATSAPLRAALRAACRRRCPPGTCGGSESDPCRWLMRCSPTATSSSDLGLFGAAGRERLPGHNLLAGSASPSKVKTGTQPYRRAGKHVAVALHLPKGERQKSLLDMACGKNSGRDVERMSPPTRRVMEQKPAAQMMAKDGGAAATCSAPAKKRR